jgi:hypothetical protein
MSLVATGRQDKRRTWHGIWVKSQEGVGSTFTFMVPVRRGE